MSSGADHPRRPAGTDTRQRILVAAVELFADRGFAGTSIRDIAETLGMTKAALYYHFVSKEEILQAVVAPLRQEMDDLARWAVGPPRPEPAELLAALAELLSRHAPLLSSVFGDPSAGRHGPAGGPRTDFAVLAAALAGSADPDRLLRARCALGAMFGGVIGAAATDRRFVEPPRGARAVRLLNREDHLLDDRQRQQVVDAALRALDGPGQGDAPSQGDAPAGDAG